MKGFNHLLSALFFCDSNLKEHQMKEKLVQRINAITAEEGREWNTSREKQSTSREKERLKKKKKWNTGRSAKKREIEKQSGEQGIWQGDWESFLLVGWGL